ncbi:unnamed protein product [Urochloa humidicola]
MIDTKGQAWRTIDVPSNGKERSGCVSHSQGHLVYVDIRTKRVAALAIYVLEDHSRDRWTLRHKVSAGLFGLGKFPAYHDDNPVIAFHPTRDVFFCYDREGKRLMSYDMKAKRDRWTLKHKVSNAVLFGLGNLPSWTLVVAFHPTCDVLFLYDRKGEMLLSYDMNQKRAHAVCALEDVEDAIHPFFLYVPLYSGTLDRHMSGVTISDTILTS